MIVACEPSAGEEMGLGALRGGRGGGRARRRLVLETVRAEPRTDAATPDRELMHELSISSAIVDTALRHAAGRRVEVDV